MNESDAEDEPKYSQVVSQDGAETELVTTNLPRLIRRWLNNPDADTTGFVSYFLNQEAELNEVTNITGQIILRPYLYKMATPSVHWPPIMDFVTDTLQTLVANMIYRRRVDKKFIPHDDVPFDIYRNLLESRKHFQQKDFGVDLVFGQEKNTLRSIATWIGLKKYPLVVDVFITTFVTCYFALNVFCKNAYKIDFFESFWKVLTLQQRIQDREISHKSIYEKGSWVYHPLTQEEDDEYLSTIGDRLLTTEREQIRTRESINRDANETRKYWILNARIKVLIVEIESTVQQMDTIAKKYNNLLANEYFAQWAVAKRRKKKLQEDSDRILTALTDIGIYDVNASDFAPLSIGLDELGLARNALIGNAKTLFAICDVVYANI